MNKVIFFFVVLFSISSFSQETIKEVLKKYNNENVPYITTERIKSLNLKNSFLLDARELKEFEVSHIKNAIHVGYDKFDLETTIKLLPNKNAFIVVYCTLGVRSEDIGEKLKAAGYTNVFNHFGGIVDWKNKGNIVVDMNGKETKKVHVSSKEWGKWLKKGKKVY